MSTHSFEAVIGLEVHCQLSTETKIFCSCRARLKTGQSVSDLRSNQNTCPVCAGHPGSLPVLNRKAVEYAIRAGLATGCTINTLNIFARKNYFYPDLPKGYQISQYESPICEGGHVDISSSAGSKTIRIQRIHLEEDAGKNTHFEGYSLVNLNRAGVPLIEIVTHPDLSTPEEAGAYLRALYATVTQIGVCDGNLQEGNFRCDANVSVRPKGSSVLGTRAEIKNVNSFKFVEKAIQYEIDRQTQLVRSGGKVVQETRTYDSELNVTSSMRSKEEAHDYRYFPDPDLIPIQISQAWIEEIRRATPELPEQRRARLKSDHGLSDYDAALLMDSLSLFKFYEAVLATLKVSKQELPTIAKAVANLLATEVLRLQNDTQSQLESSQLRPAHVADLITLLQAGTISGSAAKKILQAAWNQGGSVAAIVDREGLRQVSDTSTLEPIVDKIIAANPSQVAEYRAGKDKLLAFFVGQAMKASAGKANPGLVQELVKKKIVIVIAINVLAETVLWAGGESRMKKLLVVLGAVFGLLVVAAVVVPLVVDVDKYRPQIVQAANDNLNGKLELGKLKLSLWGQVKVEVGGVNLVDAQGKKILSVQDAFFHLPFLSILNGSPQVTLKMVNPELSIVSDAAGKLNVAKLSKTAPVSTASGSSSQGSAPTHQAGQASSGSRVAVPALVANARLGFELKNAQMTYRDEKSGLDSKVSNLNVMVHGVSLTKPMDFNIWVDDLDTKMGKTLSVKGPAKLSGKIQSRMSGGELKDILVSLLLDLDGLEVEMPGTFHKKKGMIARLEGELSGSNESLKVQKLQLKFFNAEINGSGSVGHLVADANGKVSPVVDLSFRSNEMGLGPWTELLPKAKDFDLGGVARVKASVKGPAEHLDYAATFEIQDLAVRTPMLKEKPIFNVLVEVATDRIEKFQVVMSSPETDLKLVGKMLSFSKPQIVADITSPTVNLDPLLGTKVAAAGAASESGAASGATGASGGKATGTGGSATKTSSDFDAMLAPLRDSPIMSSMTAQVGINIKKFQAYGVQMTDIVGRMGLRDLTVSLDNFGMNLWSGHIGSNMAAQLKPKTPAYRFNLGVSGLDLQKAVDSQLHLFKNTVIGKAFFKIDGTGSSFNPAAAMSHLNAKGNLKVDHAKFTSIDVGKMATEALGKTLEKVGDKIPGLKGKTFKLGGRESRYDYVQTDFTIADGRFSSPNFVAKAEANQGIDLKGSTQVGLIDYSLTANWELIDTYNFTHARDISVDIGGQKIDHILADGNNPVRFPVSVGGTLNAPSYSYSQVPEALGKVAMNNFTRGATAKAKSEVTKKLLEHAPPELQKGLGGLGKKLFGH